VREQVKGLIRMVQVAPKMTVVDMTLKGVKSGVYDVSVRERGDISQGAESTGGVWEEKVEGSKGRGIWGTISVGQSGVGSVFIDKPVQIWEMIGRAVVVSKRLEDGRVREKLEREDEEVFVGVVARSAGVWDNDKTVCSCSGKTVWEERREQVGKGML